MLSLEEPLGLDKLPSMSTIDRIQRFSSGACRPRVDNLGLGNYWIERQSCSTSNNYKHECRLVHDEWINIVKNNLHPVVSTQLQEKIDVADVDIKNSKSIRSEIRAALNSLLKAQAVGRGAVPGRGVPPVQR
ncbi:hypothetical protein RJT34_24490 [Clitoria ternatea]|uniref:Uncharacterized protein n=1 Tax=Clitoria ternatea TaxID=43366 RepID=A0AAN9FN00_CLITE